MADETLPPPGAPGQPDRRRPAPTIELEATEIASEPVAAAAAGAEQAPPPEPPPDQDTAPKMPPKSAVHSSLSGLAASVSWPLVGAGVTGAALMLAIVWVVVALTAGQGADPSATEARIAQLERQVAGHAGADAQNAASAGDLANRLQKLEAQLGRQDQVLPAAPRPAPDPALPNRIAALETQLISLNDMLSALGARSDSTAAANAAALSELGQKLARADKSEAQSSEASGAAANQDAAAITALANRIDALEGGAKALKETLEKTLAAGRAADEAKRNAETSDDRAVRAAIIAAALAAAVERGDPFESELKAAQAQSPDASALAPLADFAAAGVPGESALARELTSLAPDLMRAAGAVPSEPGFLQKLQANAERLVRIRPIDQVAGDDPAAIVARVEIKAGRGDVTGALMELDTLPASVRAPAQAWIGKAQARAAAIAASRAFAAAALAALATRSH
jgi:hypothetical protein